MRSSILRVIVFVALIFGALGMYSMGIQSGAFVLVLLGMLLEGSAWFLAFRRKRTELK